MRERLQPPGAEPFSLERGPAGCLLVHGFGGSPAEMRGLGDYLAARNISVLGVSLAGHDGTPEQFGRVRWQDWTVSVDRGLDQIRERCSSVFVAGLSLGGLLALHAAVHRPLDGIAVMSAPVTLGRLDAVLVVLPMLRRVVRWWHPLRDADLDNPAVRAEIVRRFPAVRSSADDPVSLAGMRDNVRVSTRAIDQLGRVMRLVRRELHTVQVPLLVVQGCRDEWVPAECPSEIFAGAGSRDKELVWFEHSGHALLSGPEREEVWGTVHRFITTHSAQP